VADFYTVVNNYSTTLATAYTSGSSLVLASGGGAALIAKLTAEGQSPPSSMLPLRITVDDGTNQTVFKVTGRSGDTLTVLHLDGESTLPGGGYAAGSTVECRWTSGAVRETQAAINDHLSDTANPHGTTYTQVGAAAASHTHAAADITSGTLTTARGGTGLGSIGTANQVAGVNAAASGLEYKTITAGSGITVTHAANSVTIASSGGGGSPGGSSGAVQYNDAGSFGGFGTWTVGTSTLALTGSVTATAGLTANSAAGGKFFIGPLPADADYAGIWVGNITPGTSNYSFLGSYVNGFTGFNTTSEVAFRVSNSSRFVVDTNGAKIVVGTAPVMAFLTDGKIQFYDTDGGTFVTGTVGLKVGSASTDKLGFWGASAVVRPTAVADATGSGDAHTQLNALLSRLRTIGLIAT
jgi:hypothetical protein